MTADPRQRLSDGRHATIGSVTEAMGRAAQYRETACARIERAAPPVRRAVAAGWERVRPNRPNSMPGAIPISTRQRRSQERSWRGLNRCRRFRQYQATLPRERRFQRFDQYAEQPRQPVLLISRRQGSVLRALARDPELLLLDEPTSALDPATRDIIMAELVAEIRRLGLPTLAVTHDPHLAVMADWMALLVGHRVVQEGTPR